jgi:hypothetical protein
MPRRNAFLSSCFSSVVAAKFAKQGMVFGWIWVLRDQHIGSLSAAPRKRGNIKKTDRAAS